MMEAIVQTSIYTNQMIDEIIQQQATTLQFAKSKLKWYTSEFNDLLFSQPYFKQQKMGEILGVTSRTTLVKYAEQLVSNGIVSHCSSNVGKSSTVANNNDDDDSDDNSDDNSDDDTGTT
jgi:hypothetical protein